METKRPDPDELLAHVQSQEERRRRGRLKIFLGAVAGVGKTYSMLEFAQTLREQGLDVVAGYIEPHRRPETEALLDGFEALETRVIDYKGAQLREFDLDAALARHPKLILVDELAHTNAPGSRHPKRWQDVEELLDAGINVWTTVNIQHLESLNDVVAQITGTTIRETIPDHLLEDADEVELIDLSPDDLLKRLDEGKVYVSEQAQQAVRNFFRKGNLMALRELALRRTAERVDEQMQDYRFEKAIANPWPAGERILVCISPSPLAGRLIRAAKRLATRLHAEWITVYVETPKTANLPEQARTRVLQTLRLAEQLGAETVTLHGHNVAEEILSYAHKRNVTKIVIGKPAHPVWRDLFYGSMLNRLVRHSGAIDVYVISGDAESSPLPVRQALPKTIPWIEYLQALVVVIICSVISSLALPLFVPSNLVMIYLVGVVVVAARTGRGASTLASFLSVLAFDFFFVPPHLTFAVSDTQYVFTFGVMLLVALTISDMTLRIKQQAETARERELRTSGLFDMSRAFASTNSIDALTDAALLHIGGVFESQALLQVPDSAGELQLYSSEDVRPKFTPHEQSVARWVYDHIQPAGFSTETLPASEGLYLPLLTPQGRIGVLGVFPTRRERFLSTDQLHLLETYANQTALALERARLTQEAERAQIQIEAERLRSSLLSSVSHDLRTPLAAITGAVSGLLQREPGLDSGGRELAQIAYEESERLNRLVGNLLEMTRLESGTVKADKEWQPLEEVIGTTLMRLDRLLESRPLKTNLPDDLPLVPIDGVMIEQVLVNLLENAVKYSPSSTPIELSAWSEGNEVVVEVADRGVGLPPGEEEHIFDKFYRVRPTVASGVGLGLAICRAVVQAHGGRIWAANRTGGGAAFRFTLPLDGIPPRLEND